MNFEKKLSVSLKEIQKKIEEGDSEAAITSLNNLWSVTSTLGKNKEAISCSYIHEKETIEKAKSENTKILGSIKMLHDIEL
jgi:hypothetical protein